MMKVTRRAAIAGVAGATLGFKLAVPAVAASPRRTFVLVHGAWHGGWCWTHVRRILEESGHRVYTPTLTGLGDRSHLLSTSVNLSTHVNDVANLFSWEDIEDAVLVAHSYGGWVCSGALEKIGTQVHSAVFVDAFLPENGQMARDLNSPKLRAALDQAVKNGEAGRPVPDANFFKIVDPKNVAWVRAKMTPQPTNTATEALVLTDARERISKKTYIRAPRFQNPNFDRYLAKTKSDEDWNTFVFPEEESGHDVMVDAPAHLAQLLEEAAS